MIKALSHFLFATLRGRLIVSVAVVHAVLMTLFIVDLTVRQRSMLLDRQIEEATALSQALATSAAGWIAADDISGLQEIVEAQRRYPELLFAILVDEEGRALASTNVSELGQYMLDLPQETSQTMLSNTPALVDVATPAMIGHLHVGWARVGIGQAAAGEKLAEITRDGVMYALAAIFIGSVIAWFMGQQISRRLYAVQETISAVHSGNHLARSSLVGTDEAAVMAREFNTMLDTLAKRDAELRASEKKYRSLIDKVQAAIVVHDNQGHILTGNPLAQRLLGLSEDQLLGKALIDPEWHFLREDGSVMPVAEYPVSLVLSARQPLRDYVTGISRPDRDDVTWALVNGEPEYNDAGAIERIIVSFIDITERKQTEDALHHLNRELRAISNCNEIMMRAVDEQTLLGAICRIVCEEAGYRMTWVGYAENDEAKTVRPVAWAGVEEGYLAAAGITWADTERGRGPSGVAIRRGESTCIQDFATDPQAAPWRENAMQRGYRSSIALPLKEKNGHSFGVLCIYSIEPNVFTPDETRLLEELADNLAFGISVLRDRIKRKQAEQKANQLAVIVQSSDDAIIGKTLAGIVTSWNRGAEKIYGYTEKEMIGQPISLLVPPKCTNDVPQILASIKAGNPLEHFETVRRRKDGRLVDVSLAVSPIRDSGGRVVAASTIARDITERKRNEALNISRLHLIQFAETHSLDELLEETLNEVEKLTGSLISFYHLVEDDQQSLTLQSWSTATKTEFCKAEGKGLHYPISEAGVWVDCVYQRKPVIHNDYASLPHRKGMPEGHAQVIRELVVPVLRGEKITAILGAGNKPTDYTEQDVEIVSLLADLAREIAERKRGEEKILRLNQELEQRVLDRTAQLEEANKELEAFAYSVSHDLRAPLRHIDGFLDLLQKKTETSLDEQGHHYMNTISDAAKKMGLLIDDLLSFSRMGRQAMSSQRVELGTLVREVIRELESNAPGRNIEWRIGDLPAVSGDAAMLRLVLTNLISNALKFTGTREQAQIEIGPLPDQAAETVIFVRDNGVGFDMTYVDKLFGVFQRLHRAEEFEGTGIGLANVRRIIARHGGRTWAEGEVDQGATFYFALPHTLL